VGISRPKEIKGAGMKVWLSAPCRGVDTVARPRRNYTGFFFLALAAT
jgi:hypothetical protein